MVDQSRSDTREASGDASARQGTRSRFPVVFMTEVGDDGARINDALRAVGYSVVEVPLALLGMRVQADRPSVVLVDVDADSTLAEIVRIRRQPGAGAIDFVYLGTGAGPIRSSEDAISHEGSAFFLQPVDVDLLVRRVESLTGGAAVRHELVRSPPPSSVARFGSSAPPDRASTPSLPAPGVYTPGPPLPMSVSSLAELVDFPRSIPPFGTVSSELQQLLSDAEQRADVHPHPDVPLASPEEELEAVLPPDVLASLDEPIESEELEDHEPRATRTGQDRDGTGSYGRNTTTVGSRQTTTTGRSIRATPLHHDRQRIDPRSGDAIRGASEELGHERGPSEERRSERPERGPSEVPRSATLASVLVPRAIDSRRFFAEAVARRLSGALCFEHERVARRLVVRDGDLVTAASGRDEESLVRFLGGRGDIPREEASRLAGKVPPYGRHAGAALIAHGWLGQDQLWSVLRAHAEWIATSVFRRDGGTATFEIDPPGRLRSEPSVFGASTGAEVFIELVRRAVSPAEAIESLGGESSRIDEGQLSSLLTECALTPEEHELVLRARGLELGELLARSPDAEIATVVHGLALLGVVDVVPAPEPRNTPASVVDAESATLDEEAVRARIRARLELVEEGDYFAILGVGHDATSYEVRRAFLDLRRAFEPTRIVTPRLHDLAGDVRKIVVVLEEAYEILRDVARRERYRRAIDARP